MSTKLIDVQISNLFAKLEEEQISLVEADAQVNLENAASAGQAPTAAAPPAIEDEDRACPFIKTRWDNTLRFGYACEENCCLRSGKAKAVSINRQNQVCLNEQYEDCAVYSQQDIGRNSLFKKMRGFFTEGNIKTVLNSLLFFLTILLLVSVVVILYVVTVYVR